MQGSNILIQFNEDIKSIYFEKDGEIIKCRNLDRQYEKILNKIQVFEEHGGVAVWEIIEDGDTKTIIITAELANDYPDAPEFCKDGLLSGDLSITANMTWVLTKADDTIVEGVNEEEDCVTTPMHNQYRYQHQNQQQEEQGEAYRYRHMLRKLVSNEEACFDN